MEKPIHRFMRDGVEIHIEIQVYRFLWQGIEIEAVYTPLKWGTIAHLGIRSISPANAPLPITSPVPSKPMAAM